MLIRIAHLEADGSAGGATLKDAREELHVVCLVAASGDGRLARTTTCHLSLKECLIDLDACWHTVDDTAHGHTMALAEGGEAKDISECIHFFPLFITAFATSAAVTTTASAVATAAVATTTATLHVAGHLAHVVNLILLGGLAYIVYMTHEMERHTGQWMVDVTYHLVLGDLLYGGLDDVAILILERHFTALHDELREELARLRIAEELLGQGNDLLFVVFSVCFGRREHKVELVAFLKTLDISLETLDELAYAKDEFEGVTLLGLLYLFDLGLFVALCCFVASQLVVDCYMLAVFDIHILYYLYYFGRKDNVFF